MSTPGEGAPTDDIVLIDDDPMVGEFMRRVLRGSGRTLLAFDDPEAGLDYLEGRLARVLLVDMRMPTMDGPEVLARLAERGEQGGLEVLLCSASRAVRADLPTDVSLILKDQLLDRATLLDRLGGALDVPAGKAA